MRTESLQTMSQSARLALLLDAFASSEGLTQKEAGSALGIPRSSFARFARDKECVPRRRHARVTDALAASLDASAAEISRFGDWSAPVPHKLLQLVATNFVQLRDRNTYEAAETLTKAWSEKAVTVLAMRSFPPFMLPELIRRHHMKLQVARGRSRSRARRSALMHRYIAPSFHSLLDRCEMILPQSVWQDFNEGGGSFAGVNEGCHMEFKDYLREDLCRDGGLKIRILPDTEETRPVLQHFAESSVVVYIRGVGIWYEKADCTQVRILKQLPALTEVDLLKWDRQIIELARQLSTESLKDSVASVPDFGRVLVQAMAA